MIAMYALRIAMMLMAVAVGVVIGAASATITNFVSRPNKVYYCFPNSTQEPCVEGFAGLSPNVRSQLAASSK
ncbi:MAG TPA: hypothetical protein VGK73_31800 [Polyangiaceae bacterium]